jgi:hypothetical protein
MLFARWCLLAASWNKNPVLHVGSTSENKVSSVWGTSQINFVDSLRLSTDKHNELAGSITAFCWDSDVIF